MKNFHVQFVILEINAYSIDRISIFVLFDPKTVNVKCDSYHMIFMALFGYKSFIATTI